MKELKEWQLEYSKGICTGMHHASKEGNLLLGALDEIDMLVGMIRDVVEDETEFETDWNKAAREVIARYDS